MGLSSVSRFRKAWFEKRVQPKPGHLPGTLREQLPCQVRSVVGVTPRHTLEIGGSGDLGNENGSPEPADRAAGRVESHPDLKKIPGVESARPAPAGLESKGGCGAGRPREVRAQNRDVAGRGLGGPDGLAG